MKKSPRSIDAIIAQFAEDLEAAIRAEVQERLVAAIKGAKPAAVAKGKAKPAEPAPGSGRRVRRSAEQLAEVQEKIVKLLSAEPKLTSEEIQAKLNLRKDDIQRPLQLLRDSGEVKTIGERRSMRHFVGAGRPGVVKRVKPAE